MKLISILGYDRSGTTFLGSYLSNVSNDIFYAGEIDKGIEKYFSGKNKNCSCGSSYSQCVLWGRVFPAMKGPADLQTVFEKIEQITGAKLVVDSSKSFTHIKRCKDLFMENYSSIHVIRNPKGVVLSRKKIRESRISKNSHPKPEIAKQYNLMMLYDCFEWSFTNIWIEKFKKRTRNLTLIYDLLELDLPEKIHQFLELQIGKTPMGNDMQDHIVWGNKGRHNFNSNIVVSKNWMGELSTIQKFLIGGVTQPVNILYGYKY